MKKILREPLFYFLMLGGFFFVLFQLVSDQGFGDSSQLEKIVVSKGRIQALKLGFEKVWQRPPGQKELNGLIQSFIKEEVMYREALALGLDQGDPIVRRRLRQKIEFLFEDLTALEEPDDSELQAYLDANPEAYRQPSRFSFQQVYLNTSQRGPGVETDAKELLARLRAEDIDAASAGDSLMLKRQFVNETDRDIERALGRQFLDGLVAVPSGSWQGPVVSGFGLHLVYIHERIDGEIPELSAARDQVFRDWSSEQRKKTNQQIYQNLRKRYEVTVEDPLSENTNNASLTKVVG
jgi:parvulin-like peptidyl-prolyl isomerase